MTREHVQLQTKFKMLCTCRYSEIGFSLTVMYRTVCSFGYSIPPVHPVGSYPRALGPLLSPPWCPALEGRSCLDCRTLWVAHSLPPAGCPLSGSLTSSYRRGRGWELGRGLGGGPRSGWEKGDKSKEDVIQKGCRDRQSNSGSENIDYLLVVSDWCRDSVWRVQMGTSHKKMRGTH